ncbi:MAG TPA: site-specific DNA-methyltransferase [Pseudoflavonifractor sp.]|nr:site-specific DNA-methyltransferase [Pseudoflavonifractor sp.]
MNTTTTLVIRPVGVLVPYAQNARQHSPEQILQLRASLRAFGFVAPLLIDTQDNVLAGHGRLLAAIAEGMPDVPCVLVEHLTEIQRRAYILVDNRLAEQASWDAELVSLELQGLHEAGFDIDLTGFDESDIILEESTDVFEDDEFDPTPPNEPRARRGQIYQLGRHRLMCGDATEPEDVAALMDGATADLLLTDPPYNVGIVGQTEDALTILNDDFKDDDEFCHFLQRAFSAALPVLEPGAPFYIWHPDGAPGWAFRQACRAVGLKIRQCLVWIKQAATLSRQDYHWQHEPCLHGQAKLEDLPEMDRGEGEDFDHEAYLYGWADGRAHLWNADRKQTTVLMFDRPTRSEKHPTMKPVKMMAYQICNSTRPGARVADFFGGSGSTLVAAEQTGRTAYLMELDPSYIDVIIARWEAFTGQKAELVAA